MNIERAPLRFGIPSLDRLLGKKDDSFEYGFACPPGASTSLCLIGPHGTGKSVLGLHFASSYFANFLYGHPAQARVFYVSTDLTSDLAQQVWSDFSLNRPFGRINPFERAGRTRPDQIKTVKLRPMTPYGDAPEGKNIAKLLAAPVAEKAVTFVDLASASAGDDWGFIHRLIAVLQDSRNGQASNENAPLHLVVVDAVDGLETLVGESDAFGERTSRRARIAQMLRTASRKCHLLFIAEEPGEGKQIPEEFVADVVLRLRTVRENAFDRRTVEIQKARGQSHIRGQHPYVIRRGAGSTTGDSPNLDDPRVSSIGDKCQAYVAVMPSLHSIMRGIMEKQGDPRPDPNRGFAAFGIPNLDKMLGGPKDAREDRGLPCSTVTALIGDAGTHKSALGKCFLFRALYPYLSELLNRSITAYQKRRAGSRRAEDWVKPLEGKPVPPVILLTTSDIDANGLSKIFLEWTWIEDRGLAETSPKAKTTFMRKCGAALRTIVSEWIICRRFEIHSQTSEIVVHILRMAVWRAQEKIGMGPGVNSPERYRRSSSIRLVIDDFSILRSMYPTIGNYALFLPFLVFFLKREGISTLVVDTRPGRPDRDATSLLSDDPRALTDNHLYTSRGVAIVFFRWRKDPAACREFNRPADACELYQVSSGSRYG